MTGPDILVVGDLMIDVVVSMREEFHYGSDTACEISSKFGGTGGNVTSWIAAAGGRPLAVGVVGSDHWGRSLVQHLQTKGAKTAIRHHQQLPTGMVIALTHPDGERSMLPDSRANASLTIDDFADIDWSSLKWLYISGYTLMNPATTQLGEELMATARNHGTQVLLDPASAAPLRQVPREQLESWLRAADLLLPNQLEVEVLAAGADAAKLLELCPIVIAKLGAAGARLMRRGQPEVAIPAVEVHVVDTVGAGDAFAAGLLAALSNGVEVAAACHAATELAARAVAMRGAQPESADL